MKIALFHDLPSGGGKKALFETVRMLHKIHQFDEYSFDTSCHSFCDITLFCKQTHRYPFKPSPLFGSPFGRLNQFQRWRDLGRLENLSRQIAQDIDREKYDLVFVQPSRFTQAPLFIQHLKTPSVYYMHEPLRQVYDNQIPRPYFHESKLRKSLDRIDPLIKLYRQKLKELDRVNAQSATLVLANSTYTVNNIQQIYNIAAQVSYLGVDTSTFHPMNLPREDFFLSVGEIRPSKGFDFLIQALSMLPDPVQYELRLIGNAQNTAEKDYLTDLARERGVRLSFQILVDLSTLVRTYNSAKLVIYAPVSEPFGFVPIEAMACGTPIIGVAEGGLKESIRDMKTGVLTCRDPKEFAGAVERVIKDPVLYDTLSTQGRRDVEMNWQWSAAAERINQSFCQLVS